MVVINFENTFKKNAIFLLALKLIMHVCGKNVLKSTLKLRTELRYAHKKGIVFAE